MIPIPERHSILHFKYLTTYSSNSCFNRPFLSSLNPLFQTSPSVKLFIWKWDLHAFIFMQMKVIFIRMVSHLDSLWNRGTKELRNGLFFKLKCIWQIFFDFVIWSSLVPSGKCVYTLLVSSRSFGLAATHWSSSGLSKCFCAMWFLVCQVSVCLVGSMFCLMEKQECRSIYILWMFIISKQFELCLIALVLL